MLKSLLLNLSNLISNHAIREATCLNISAEERQLIIKIRYQCVLSTQCVGVRHVKRGQK